MLKVFGPISIGGQTIPNRHHVPPSVSIRAAQQEIGSRQ
jgi:2,4-dienoyl-CoA reductase-like NADH-dependent reductase (Old Yellow Enzyme family)